MFFYKNKRLKLLPLALKTVQLIRLHIMMKNLPSVNKNLKVYFNINTQLKN